MIDGSVPPSSKRKENSLYCGFALVLFAGLFFCIALIRIFYIQNTTDERFAKTYIENNFRTRITEPVRGNIYAADGSLLATTVIRYNAFVDFRTIRKDIFDKGLQGLCQALSRMFGKSESHYRKLLLEQRKAENQYFPLAKNLDYDQYQQIKNFPIFERGPIRGGIIFEKIYKRQIASAQIGNGTIGVDDSVRGHSGMEGAFSEILRGRNGKMTEQRLKGNQWKPINFWNIVEPINGDDVVTTIDLRIQDIAHVALEKQLSAFNAEHGSAIVLEVATGKVRAMVNLKRKKTGVYEDSYNYILKDATEPGSTFKTISLLAAMDDQYIGENTRVETGSGTWTYDGQVINDGHSGGLYDISDVLAQSSNVGTSKLIVKSYAQNPNKLFEHLRKWQLHKKLGIEYYSGSTKPIMVSPEDKRWRKSSLASISYGYNIRLNMLQMATFYNGLANGGNMIRPVFYEKILREGKPIKEAKPSSIVPKMASPQAIQLMTRMLTKAVEKGTARSIYTPNLRLAGKTGTTRLQYWNKSSKKYQASFAGFYPADKPLYTCMISITEPDVSIGYYGSQVAAPVFKEIAGKTFLKMPINADTDSKSDPQSLNKLLIGKQKKVKLVPGIMPDLVGTIGRDIIPKLENSGYKVHYTGIGKVVDQFPQPGQRIHQGQIIQLKLEN